MTCTLEPAIQSGDTGQWMAFLTAVDVYYQVTYRLYTVI